MIYGFVKQSGGQVRVASQPGVGTAVHIYLPRDAGTVEDDVPENKTPEPVRTSTGETILVVDDEPTVRMVVTDVLEGLGYAAIEVADAASGLKVLQSNVRIDLLIADIGLPGSLTGLQMADEVRSERPDLKVLFITGYPMRAITKTGRLEKNRHILMKPFTLETLANRIKVILSGG